MIERCVTIVGGVSRSGKSTFALRYLINKNFAYRFIFDAETGPQSYAVRLNCDGARTDYELGKQLMRQWVIFNPHHLYEGRPHEALDDFCEWSHEMSKRLPGRKVLMLSEAWKYLNPRKYPERIAACVQNGAAYGMECLFDSQTPQYFPEPIQNECTEIVCFNLTGEKTLDWAESKGFERAEVAALPQLHYVARNMVSRGELRGRIEL